MPPSGTPLPDSAQLARKLMWYGAAAGVAGLVGPSDAQAQIVYRDLVPDVLVLNNDAGVPMDFDLDGDPEILFRERPTSAYSLTNKETTLGTDVLTVGVFSTVSSYDYWLPLASGSPISGSTTQPATLNFQSFTFLSSDPNGWLGQDAYIGVGFTLNDGTHYGWVHIQFTTGGAGYTLKELAYNATPNTAINAGDHGTTAVEPGALAEGYLFSELAPSPVVSRSTFELAVGRSEHVRADVFDVSGRQVATILDQTLPAQELQRVAFDASGLPAGVYIVRVTGESFVTSRRVVVAH